MKIQDNQFLNIRDLVIEFRNKGKKFKAVKGVNFDINKGEIFGLVGESGSGKTTIGRAIVGVQPVKDGTIYLEGQPINGKATNLYNLNKEIYSRIKNIELKTLMSTTYLNRFLNTLKNAYQEYKLDSDAFTNEKIIKLFKKSNIRFVDTVLLKNLKYVNRIIIYFDRINQFVKNIHEHIPKISIELENAILSKNSSTKEEFKKIKDLLNEMYKSILEIRKIIENVNLKSQKQHGNTPIKFDNLIEKIFTQLKIVTNGQKELIAIIPIINSLEFQNLVLSAPLRKRNHYKQHYYDMVFVRRDAFYTECNAQLTLLNQDPNANQKTIRKYQDFLKDFWSKENINISLCETILKKISQDNITPKLFNLTSKLKETHFEGELKKIISNQTKPSEAKINKLQIELKEIKNVIRENIIRDDEMIFEYYNWKNIKNENELQSRETILKLLTFLELPSIDELVRDSLIFKKLTNKEKKINRKNVQMIFQDPGSSLNDRMAIEEIISEGLENFSELYKSEEAKNEYLEHHNIIQPGDKLTLQDVKPSEVKKYIVLKLITSVGLLPEHLSRYPHEFSGGQRQRVGIARSLAMRPKVIVADEPISALDVSIRAQVLNLFKKFKDEYDLTYLFITHDLSVVRFIADRIAVIYHGQIVELAYAEELFKNPLHPYTKSLLSAVPIPEPSLAKEKNLEVYDPAIEHADYIFDIPSFVEVKKGHFVYANKRELKQIAKTLKK